MAAAAQPDLDQLDLVARIQRSIEEARKFSAESHKLSEEALKLSAESHKLNEESAKFRGESFKLRDESLKLRRDRSLAPFLIFTGLLASGMSALIGALVSHFPR